MSMCSKRATVLSCGSLCRRVGRFCETRKKQDHAWNSMPFRFFEFLVDPRFVGVHHESLEMGACCVIY